MVWEQLWVDKPHVAYALIGGFVSVFSLISLFVKEKLYIGEATVATIFGLIVGPHCLNWFAPTTWGNTDFITIEVSRIVLVVQIFAVAVELPKKYMLRHWLSVVILLLPVMTFGWLLSSVFIWKLVPTLSWIEGLAIAACVTATDPVLASAVVGKGKFARRVPGHLRNLLSAESGCNDGMAFPFAYLAINIINHAGHPGTIAKDFIAVTILYECVFGCVLGAIIGYSGRHLIKFAEKHNLIDRESFLVFYFVLALFCTGVGTIIGTDDLLVSFAAGTAFSWDGWFSRKTEESHVSNVIDLLLNMAYFVYFGAIVPWEQFNNGAIGIQAWKLVILAILIFLFRRIPIMLAVKPIVPDIRNWREALFCGHFGPIGVGAVFIAILSRAELEHGEPTPLANLPPDTAPHFYAIATIWPITTFLVVSSIIVHGSSIAVFTLGKRLNNMTITMSYTTAANNNQSWLSRLPRIETGGKTLSLHRYDTDASRLSIGLRKRKRSEKIGQPIELPVDMAAGEHVSDFAAQNPGEATAESKLNDGIAAFQEGSKIIIEDEQGEVVAQVDSKVDSGASSSQTATSEGGPSRPEAAQIRDRISGAEPQRTSQESDRRARASARAEHRPGRRVIAYQLDDDIIVENEDGEILKRYRINRKPQPSTSGEEGGSGPGSLPKRAGSFITNGLERTLSKVGLGKKPEEQQPAQTAFGPDVEKNVVDDIVPVEDRHTNEKMDYPFDEDTIKRHLKNLFKTGNDTSLEGQPVGGGGGGPSAPTTSQDRPSTTEETREHRSPPRDQSANYSREDLMESPDVRSRLPTNFLGPMPEDEAAPPEVQSQDIGDDDETEVERKRRLAALGLLQDPQNEDDDDEEDDYELHRTTVPAPIREEDEEEAPAPKIHWSDDVRRG